MTWEPRQANVGSFQGKPGPKRGGVDCCRQRLQCRKSRENERRTCFEKSERFICEEVMKRKTSLKRKGF